VETAGETRVEIVDHGDVSVSVDKSRVLDADLKCVIVATNCLAMDIWPSYVTGVPEILLWDCNASNPTATIVRFPEYDGWLIGTCFLDWKGAHVLFMRLNHDEDEL
jgi:hypothetical protein